MTQLKGFSGRQPEFCCHQEQSGAFIFAVTNYHNCWPSTAPAFSFWRPEIQCHVPGLKSGCRQLPLKARGQPLLASSGFRAPHAFLVTWPLPLLSGQVSVPSLLWLPVGPPGNLPSQALSLLTSAVSAATEGVAHRFWDSGRVPWDQGHPPQEVGLLLGEGRSQ